MITVKLKSTYTTESESIKKEYRYTYSDIQKKNVWNINKYSLESMRAGFSQYFISNWIETARRSRNCQLCRCGKVSLYCVLVNLEEDSSHFYVFCIPFEGCSFSIDASFCFISLITYDYIIGSNEICLEQILVFNWLDLKCKR